MFPSNRPFILHVLIDQNCDCLLLFRFSRLFFRGWHKIQRLTQDSVSTSGLLQRDTKSCATFWPITGRHHAVSLSCKPINSQHFITWPPYRVIKCNVRILGEHVLWFSMPAIQPPLNSMPRLFEGKLTAKRILTFYRSLSHLTFMSMVLIFYCIYMYCGKIQLFSMKVYISLIMMLRDRAQNSMSNKKAAFDLLAQHLPPPKWKWDVRWLRGTLLGDQRIKKWPCQITCPANWYPWTKSRTGAVWMRNKAAAHQIWPKSSFPRTWA